MYVDVCLLVVVATVFTNKRPVTQGACALFFLCVLQEVVAPDNRAQWLSIRHREDSQLH